MGLRKVVWSNLFRQPNVMLGIHQWILPFNLFLNRDVQINSFLFPAWPLDSWNSFCMLADAKRWTFNVNMFLVSPKYYSKYLECDCFQATLNGLPLYNTTFYEGGHKKGKVVSLLDDETGLGMMGASGAITDLHIWSRLLTDQGILLLITLIWFLYPIES